MITHLPTSTKSGLSEPQGVVLMIAWQQQSVADRLWLVTERSLIWGQLIRAQPFAINKGRSEIIVSVEQMIVVE